MITKIKHDILILILTCVHYKEPHILKDKESHYKKTSRKSSVFNCKEPKGRIAVQIIALN